MRRSSSLTRWRPCRASPDACSASARRQAGRDGQYPGTVTAAGHWARSRQCPAHRAAQHPAERTFAASDDDKQVTSLADGAPSQPAGVHSESAQQTRSLRPAARRNGQSRLPFAASPGLGWRLSRGRCVQGLAVPGHRAFHWLTRAFEPGWGVAESCPLSVAAGAQASVPIACQDEKHGSGPAGLCDHEFWQAPSLPSRPSRRRAEGLRVTCTRHSPGPSCR